MALAWSSATNSPGRASFMIRPTSSSASFGRPTSDEDLPTAARTAALWSLTARLTNFAAAMKSRTCHPSASSGPKVRSSLRGRNRTGPTPAPRTRRSRIPLTRGPAITTSITVSGSRGMDEAATSGSTRVAELNVSATIHFSRIPAMHRLSRPAATAVAGIPPRTLERPQESMRRESGSTSKPNEETSFTPCRSTATFTTLSSSRIRRQTGPASIAAPERSASRRLDTVFAAGGGCPVPSTAERALLTNSANLASGRVRSRSLIASSSRSPRAPSLVSLLRRAATEVPRTPTPSTGGRRFNLSSR